MLKDNFFFAVFPDRDAAEEIAIRARCLRRRSRLGGNPIAAHRLHISLSRFNVHTDNERKLVQTAERAVANMEARSFGVSLNYLASYKGREAHHPLVYLPDSQSAAKLNDLYRELCVELKKITPGVKFALSINPHVTLMYAHHMIGDEYPVDPVIRMSVKEFALIRSLTGRTIYKTLGKWRVGD